MNTSATLTSVDFEAPEASDDQTDRLSWDMEVPEMAVQRELFRPPSPLDTLKNWAPRRSDAQFRTLSSDQPLSPPPSTICRWSSTDDDSDFPAESPENSMASQVSLPEIEISSPQETMFEATAHSPSKSTCGCPSTIDRVALPPRRLSFSAQFVDSVGVIAETTTAPQPVPMKRRRSRRSSIEDFTPPRNERRRSSIARISQRWRIPLEDAAEMCKIFELQQGTAGSSPSVVV